MSLENRLAPAKRSRARSAVAALAGKRVLFVVNVDWFFLSHRLPLARAARDAGAEVHVAAVDTGQAARIRREGLGFVPITLSRGGVNPLREVGALLRMVRLYRRLRPDLVHHVTIKPVVYGGIARHFASRAAVVNAVSGLGYSYSDHARARALRPIVDRLLRLALVHERGVTIFQNEHDRELFVSRGLVCAERTALIRGSGVDCGEFSPGAEPRGSPIVLLASRLLWDKGVDDFVAAARRLRSRGVAARFVLAGAADDDNPLAVSRAQLEAWVEEGVVEWWGHRSDMPDVLRSASIAVLPSRYPEGVPKALIEAAAAGLPLVASDTPGCRDIVRHDDNGLLVAPGDETALAGALTRLLEDDGLRRHFGHRGRQLARCEFSLDLVVSQTLELYERLLTSPSGRAVA